MCDNKKPVLIVDINVYDTINKESDANTYEISLDQYERIMNIVSENSPKEALYLDDITGELGAMLDKDMSDLDPEVVKAVQNAYDTAAKKL